MKGTIEIITFIALMISTSSLLISLKSFIKTLRCNEDQLHLSALLGEVLQTVKLNVECNKQFCEFLMEHKCDRHTVCSNRTTKKTRRTSDK